MIKHRHWTKKTCLVSQPFKYVSTDYKKRKEEEERERDGEGRRIPEAFFIVLLNTIFLSSLQCGQSYQVQYQLERWLCDGGKKVRPLFSPRLGCHSRCLPACLPAHHELASHFSSPSCVVVILSFYLSQRLYFKPLSMRAVYEVWPIPSWGEPVPGWLDWTGLDWWLPEKWYQPKPL